MIIPLNAYVLKLIGKLDPMDVNFSSVNPVDLLLVIISSGMPYFLLRNEKLWRDKWKHHALLSGFYTHWTETISISVVRINRTTGNINIYV